MDKVIFIGKSRSGKTTLCQKLNEMEIQYRKTQAVELYDNAIDTPGEYLENRRFYSALIMTAVDAKLIAIVGDPTAEENYIPPAFTGSFSKEVIGIITKIKLVDSLDQIKKVEKSLKEAGVQRIFMVDTIEGYGIKELFDYLNLRLNKTKDEVNS